MPSIYQARCSACDYVSPRHAEGYLAVILDEPSNSLYALREDPRLVILAHPLESMIMEELGFTDWSAGLSGRILRIHNVACRACGTFYELRRLSAGSAALGGRGCLVMLGLAGAIGGYVGWKCESFPIGFIAGWLGLIALFAGSDSVLSLYVRRRFKDRAKEFDRGPGCPKCESKSHATFSALWSVLPCPNCSKVEMRMRIVGKS